MRPAVFAGCLFAILLAGALRLPRLADRPMHCDEAINADKSGTLLEHGSYQYDPKGFHGPTLNYLTLVPARIRGIVRYAEMDEVTLRVVPALFGLLLVPAAWLLAPAIGSRAAALAGLLTAISPAMVYYSRYYIHEMLFVFFSFGLLVGICRYWIRQSAGWAVVAGASAGMMYATKETSILVFASLACALAFNWIMERRRGIRPASQGWRSHILSGCLAVGSGAAVAVLLFSSFFSHPRGLLDSVLAYRNYFTLAGNDPLHIHPWHFYLGLLACFKDGIGPVWSEGGILLLAGIGFAVGLRRDPLPGVDGRTVRLLGFYTLMMTLLYSAVPYKTPWCMLGFLHGMILLAGIGADYLLRLFRFRWMRFSVAAALSLVMVHLGWQAWAASFPYCSDPRNPYVYAHTGKDVFLIAARVEGLARAHAEGLLMPVQIFTRENLWPLPWYFRRLPGVRWSNAVPDSIPSAPVILITPDMESALARKLYELPPPGERELYMNIFAGAVWLRPGVEVRGYAAKTLWDAYEQKEAEGHPAVSK